MAGSVVEFGVFGLGYRHSQYQVERRIPVMGSEDVSDLWLSDMYGKEV